jgi:monoamine oxidase
MAETIDVAIIGGGVSGVYSGWRLKQQDKKRSIVVYDACNHIGGRLLSVKPPDIDNMVAELGGMRILPAVQPRIAKLIDVLNAEAKKGSKIEMYDFPVDEPENLAYLRGVHLRLSDFTQKPDKVPYRLSFLEYGQTSGTILVNAIEQIVPGITAPNLNEYQRRHMARAATFAGKPLWQQGFWNVLARVISNEAFELGVDAGGYQSTLLNWNAADAIPWFLSDFGVNPEYKAFKKGFQQVPLTLQQRFEELGGVVKCNHTVQGFEWDAGAGLFRIAMKSTSEVVQAKAIILAMPRRALEILAPHSPLLNDAETRELIRSVTPRPLFKLFTTYDNPWWRVAGTNTGPSPKPLQSGRTVTDLPVRQTYYWPTDQGQPATSGPAMLMASYDDGTNIGFWDGFRERRGQAWCGEADKSVRRLAEFQGRAQQTPTADNDVWREYAAPAPMVAEVARQLGIVHGLSYLPQVVDAAFRDWGDDPFGGGWNSWNIGVQSFHVIRKIIKPHDAHQLFICGEAYSDAQGWVEGALQTADLMLEKWGVGSL